MAGTARQVSADALGSASGSVVGSTAGPVVGSVVGSAVGSATVRALAASHAEPLDTGERVSCTDCTFASPATASRLPAGTVAPITRYFAATASMVPSAASASISAASGGVE
ncbi:hypothetical protein C5E07_13825 [Pseudoclavibacter sp. RFBJ3]|nr:hypothetical protein C5C12_13565 [Pseudoclavibacter sp. RFBJ5]PPF90690.1 hypothetical protein C5E07_13825 [Pseudoclavibacter sp. RFBJ3]PPF95085.1 hypothetical protein C5C19_17610 [Pseudoclavibacter sp. RFBH5]PPG20987.1 hypothetical protein C5E13_13770 [Pseudoclavibacter sp. RFBI4]